MHLFRCFLLLALLVAVSACGLKRHHRLGRHGHRGYLGHHGHRNAIGKWYSRPKNCKSCLGSLGAFSWGINSKLGIVIDILGFYGHRKVPSSLDDGIEIIVNLSRGLSFLCNKIVPGLGGYLQKMVMGCVRYIFCVMGSPWQGGHFIDRFFTKKRSRAPAICGKDFGKKWGWRRYLKGYNSYDEIDEFYSLRNMQISFKRHIANAGIKWNTLRGTKKLILNTILNIAIMAGRSPDGWIRNDFVLLCRYVITIVAAFGRSFKKGMGYAITEELIEYLNISLRKANFDTDLSDYMTTIKEELNSCETDTLNGALVIENSSESNESQDNSSSDRNSNSDESSENNNRNSNSNSNSNNNNNNNSNSDNKNGKITKRGKTVTTIKSKIEGYGSGNGSGKSTSNSENSQAESSEGSSNSSESESSDSSSGSDSDAKAGATIETQITTEEYDVWYNEDGEIINSTRTDIH